MMLESTGFAILSTRGEKQEASPLPERLIEDLEPREIRTTNEDPQPGLTT